MISNPILVVGGSGVIGAAVAESLSIAGHSVGIHYCSNKTKATHLAAELSSINAESFALQSDLDSENSCKNLISSFVSQMGDIYGLAICCGRVPWRNWMFLNACDWDRTIHEHCSIPFFLAKFAMSHKDKLKRIVYLSSISPKYGGSSSSIHYAAAKSALETTMYGLSRNADNPGLRINGVRSGFIDTPQQRIGRSESELASRISKIPLGRAGKPREVASAFVYLFSQDADFINGELLTVAGGD